MQESLFYRCKLCGNIVAVIKPGGGKLTCCREDMVKLEANSSDASKEKHVPVVVIKDGEIKVTVGSVAHPMIQEHYIEWVALLTDNKIEIVHLKPEMLPSVMFTYVPSKEKIPFTGVDDEIVPNCEAQSCNFVYKDTTDNEATIYAYCNLHGLWKTNL